MDPLSISILAAVVGGSSALAIRWGLRRRQRTMAMWRSVAENLGGTFEPAKGFLQSTPERVQVAVPPGVVIVLDHYTVTSGRSSVTYTRLAAEAPGSGGLALKLAKQGLLARMGTALGIDDIQVGDPAFDDRFVVRGAEPETIRAWLTPRVRELVLACPPEYTLFLENGKVRAEQPGLEEVRERLGAAMNAVAALASGGRLLMKGWREVAIALGGRIDERDTLVPGKLGFIGERDGRQLAVETRAEPPETEVRRELGIRDAPKLELGVGQLLERGHFSSAGHAAWDRIQPARLVCDGESILVCWSGFVPDRERFEAAAELLAGFDVSAGGGYR
jgi:hypothetical protein